MPDFRETERWPADVNGYAICPACGCMIHMRYKKVHVEVCYGIEQIRRAITEREEANRRLSQEHHERATTEPEEARDE